MEEFIFEESTIPSQYSIAGLFILLVLGASFLLAGFWRSPVESQTDTAAWKNYRFGYPTYALIFLSFDMEMIFMYPWGVVFAEHGLTAFLDMLVFIALLSAGIAYAWGMGGLEWE